MTINQFFQEFKTIAHTFRSTWGGAGKIRRQLIMEFHEGKLEDQQQKGLISQKELLDIPPSLISREQCPLTAVAFHKNNDDFDLDQVGPALVSLGLTIRDGFLIQAAADHSEHHIKNGRATPNWDDSRRLLEIRHVLETHIRG